MSNESNAIPSLKSKKDLSHANQNHLIQSNIPDEQLTNLWRMAGCTTAKRKMHLTIANHWTVNK